MARPRREDRSLVMAEVFKVTMTSGQKEQIFVAAQLAKKDAAAWARDILMAAAAQEQSARSEKPQAAKSKRH